MISLKLHDATALSADARVEQECRDYLAGKLPLHEVSDEALVRLSELECERASKGYRPYTANN